MRLPRSLRRFGSQYGEARREPVAANMRGKPPPRERSGSTGLAWQEAGRADQRAQVDSRREQGDRDRREEDQDAAQTF